MDLPPELVYLTQQGNDYRLIHAIWNACLVCLAYDYVLTLDDEVRYIWGKRLSKARLLFWFSFKWFAYTAFISHFSIGAILTLRIHAIYSCNRTILYILSTLLCSELIAEVILIVFISDHFSVLHLSSLFPGCAPTHIVPYAWTYWIPMTVFESALFLLAAAKAVRYLLNPDTPKQTPNLALLLVRDSIIYFGSVLALILLNLVIWKAGRSSLFAVFPS
ncbi:hypothetical protein BDY19DRAFT_102160 [Irpex rosettiformis]|uniref:Uncharacterized protein n=1 Tax=Irpex rosettiformis TaxID=378272 RepID=A0ACB8U547_9APHY|nr:hypothetical protein BDY19DRAFT_102160 [Irpex rosettiformis]